MAIERVPIEIWYQIIREATYIPSWVLDGTLYDPIRRIPTRSFPKHPRQIYPILRRLLQIKISISLVCRSWSQICSEFLHEFLFIHQERTIVRLMNKYSTINMNHLHKVLRIDFLAPKDSETLSSASSLISMCPSLLAVAFHQDDLHVDSQVFEVLAESESLCCFEWYIPAHVPKMITRYSIKARNWSFYICGHSPFEREFECDGLDILDVLRDTTEKSLRYDALYPKLEQVEPIRHLVLADWINESTFLNKNHINRTMNILTINTFRYQSDLLSNLPPSVHTLVFNIGDIPASLSFIAQHVKYLGLRGSTTSSPAEFDHYFNLLIGNNAYFPSLKLIQLIDPRLASAFRKRPHQLKLWTRRCSSWGVSLCDESGNRFQS